MTIAKAVKRYLELKEIKYTIGKQVD